MSHSDNFSLWTWLNQKEEWVTYYTRKDELKAIPIERKKFEEEEIPREWPPERFVEVVHWLLVKLVRGKIHLILQYRNPNKKFNGGMLDKTFWWHCTVWYDRIMSLEIEAREELWMSLSVYNNSYEAFKYYHALWWNVHKSWIWYIADTFNLISHRKLRGWGMVTIGNRVHFSPFLYNWPTEFADTEASWTQVVPLEQIEWDIKSWNPARQWRYTQDLLFLVTRFRGEIEKIARILESSTMPLYNWTFSTGWDSGT